ncbi:MAG: hypothetical protein SF028_13695 [Candidatus Sumerlaeia bacterium]|nr:hypothetical protein [Candidatus Sumerlaeia bacterium]
MEWTLSNAYSGFRAAVLRSQAAGLPAVVHSGYWGCGAFGGNRELMPTLQAAAAALAGVRLLVLHTGAAGGDTPARNGLRILDEVAGSEGLPVGELVAALAARRFPWGFSNGT